MVPTYQPRPSRVATPKLCTSAGSEELSQRAIPLGVLANLLKSSHLVYKIYLKIGGFLSAWLPQVGFPLKPLQKFPRTDPSPGFGLWDAEGHLVPRLEPDLPAVLLVHPHLEASQEFVHLLPGTTPKGELGWLGGIWLRGWRAE